MWPSPTQLTKEALEARAHILLFLKHIASKFKEFDWKTMTLYENVTNSELDQLENGDRQGRANPGQALRMYISNWKDRISQLRLPDRAIWGTLACFAYSICSMSQTFTNKAILSESFNFKYPMLLLFFQHTFTLALVLLARNTGYVQFSTHVKWKIVRSWYPVNILFILMLISGTYALKLLTVPMVTIFKNFTTTLTTLGDFFLFGQSLSYGIVASVTLMVTSSVIAGFHDLKYDSQGYCWQGLNCLVSSGYVLYMRFAMKKTQLNEWGMVYYNNALAIPTLIPLVLLSGEIPALYNDTQEYPMIFYIMFIWSGISGFLLSVSSFWAVRTTSPSTYSMVGSLNKIPLTLLGMIFFTAKLDTIGGFSIAIGLFAGALFSVFKKKQATVKPAVELPRVSSNMLLEAK